MLHYTPGKYRLLPEGDYVFEIVSEPEEGESKGYGYCNFKFEAEDEYGNINEFSDRFMGFEDRYGNLLLALGGLEDKNGEVRMDEEENVVGKKFRAKIVHQEIDTKRGKKIGRAHV